MNKNFPETSLGIKSKPWLRVDPPDHRITAEENIHARFFVVVDLVASNRTFPVAQNHDPRAQAAVNFVALLKERQKDQM